MNPAAMIHATSHAPRAPANGSPARQKRNNAAPPRVRPRHDWRRTTGAVISGTGTDRIATNGAQTWQNSGKQIDLLRRDRRHANERAGVEVGHID